MIVLDWTGATIAAPEMDVGFTAALLRCAPIAVPRMIAPVIARVTNRLAETFVGACRSTETLDDSALDWWEALQCARCLSEVAGARVGSAVTVAEAHPFETAAPMMLRRLRQLTGVEVTLPPRLLEQFRHGGHANTLCVFDGVIGEVLGAVAGHEDLWFVADGQ